MARCLENLAIGFIASQVAGNCAGYHNAVRTVNLELRGVQSCSASSSSYVTARCCRHDPDGGGTDYKSRPINGNRSQWN